MNDLQPETTRKMRKLSEIKQELNDGDGNEGDFVKSVTLLSSQTAIKEERSSLGEASMHPNKITYINCQVKTEPQSEEEDGCELESTTGHFAPAGYVIKREIIEIPTEDHPMMDIDGNYKTIKDEDSGTEANDNWSPNLPENNIDEQDNKFGLTKEMNKQRGIGEETEMTLTQAKTLSQTKKSHKCSVCGKAFHSSQACRQHMRNMHAGENPYSCEVCGKSFKYKSILQIHKAAHSDEMPFSCDVCKKAFKFKSGLYRHKMSCLSDSRPYSCDVCNKAFKHMSGLQYHKISCHSDERPYSCDMCDKDFKLRCNLRRHKALCHSVERPYSCDVCKKAFKFNCDLQRHKMQCHSDKRPYSCDLCDKAFKQKIILQRHKTSCHSVEKPYSCDLCKKTFKLMYRLNTHKKRVHSNERPYACVKIGVRRRLD